MRFSSLRGIVACTVLGSLALLAPLPAAEAADIPHTITVSGEGEARAVPNQAQLSAGVTTSAVTADAALAENARKMTTVFEALHRLGIPDKAIMTSNFSVSPQYPPYNQSNMGPQRIVGYQVSNQVDVILADVNKLGPTLDALVTAGANQINAVSFSIKDTDALEAMAREAAVANARTRAQTYAKAAGVTLGGVIAIQEASVEAPRPMYRAMAATVAGVATPTAAGEQSVAATVTIVFELK